MTGLVTVELTEQHITAGERAVDRRLSRECNCPVANALRNAGFENAKVRMSCFTAGADNRCTGEKGERRRYRLPAAGRGSAVHRALRRQPDRRAAHLRGGRGRLRAGAVWVIA